MELIPGNMTIQYNNNIMSYRSRQKIIRTITSAVHYRIHNILLRSFKRDDIITTIIRPQINFNEYIKFGLTFESPSRLEKKL